MTASTISPAVVSAAEEFVRKELASMDASHDYSHILRVRANAGNLARLEGLSAAATALVDLAALLHDVRDWKYSGSGEETTRAVQEFLAAQGLDAAAIDRLLYIISRVGFKEELAAGAAADGVAADLSLEVAIVQDADRLDAIGAIGIARCFTFGGAKRRVLYDPASPPREELSKEAYMSGGAQATTINHFYEKLLKLKVTMLRSGPFLDVRGGARCLWGPGARLPLQSLMKTSAGAKIAEQRHAFMEQYLQQFHDEWNGRA